jgi:hypothetical protein
VTCVRTESETEQASDYRQSAWLPRVLMDICGFPYVSLEGHDETRVYHLLPNLHLLIRRYIGGLFEKFMDSPYSESELCGGAVTVSFSKYLPWQAVHFLQRSTHFPKTCCRPLITSKFLSSEFPFHGWKCPEIAWDEIRTVWRMF